MINFKKAVSIVVVFSFVLCSCGNKSPLDRDDCPQEKAKIKQCFNEVESLNSLHKIVEKGEENLKDCHPDYLQCLKDNTECGKTCIVEKKDDEFEKCFNDCINDKAVKKKDEVAFGKCGTSRNECLQNVSKSRFKFKEQLKIVTKKCVEDNDD